MSHPESNPLLGDDLLPAFAAIRAEHVLQAMQTSLANARNALQQVLDNPQAPSWETLIEPMELMAERLDRVWSPVRHLHSVMDSVELREAYEACLPLLTSFYTELSQNTALYQKYRDFADSAAYPQLQAAPQRVVDNALRDFVLGGVALQGQDRARYAAIATRLAELTSQFSNNVLDANQSWTYNTQNESDLAGLPDSALGLAQQNAREADQQGWRLTLDLPCYLPVMTYAENRDLRYEMYRAYATRASDQGPDEGKFDNTPVLEEILQLRQEMATLLGFASYAHYSLERKMAESPHQVLDFLQDLADKTRTIAEQELRDLQAFAATRHGVEELQAWDITYYSEQLKRELFDISQEDFRPYLPVDQVIGGMFAIAERLFGIRVTAASGVQTWHEAVTFYEIHDEDGELLGQLYLDPFARANKRGGAWMDVCRSRMQLASAPSQIAVAYLTCNFTPPVDGRVALITHDEVTTLFHEFGHGLHHMLTQVDIPSVSGISGVEWDAVELPSQFMENWCFEPEALALIAAHHESGEAVPDDLLDRLREARNFQSGLQMLRQIEFSMFDFQLHLQYKPGMDVMALLESVRASVAVIRPPSFNRFAHAFGHIFSGGYAAGYYSYKWAEVLSSDAYSRFEEQGVFDEQAGEDFRREILARGGTRDALDSFIAFRGRAPSVDALLRHSGIVEQPQESEA